MSSSVPQLIDTHCHFDAAEFDVDRKQVLSQACEMGVCEIWVPSVSTANFEQVRELCVTHKNCRPAYGIHPLYTPQTKAGDIQCLRDWLERERPFAIGEIGLDKFVSHLDWQQQLDIFVEQLKLAEAFNLPVLLHVRHAVEDILQQLRRIFGKNHNASGLKHRGVAHAFNGSLQQAEAFVNMGFKLGFGGAATFSGSRRIRRLLEALPLSAIVLETDAPDMPPSWLHGQRNSPTELLEIARCIAQIKGVSLETLASHTTQNARFI